MKKSIIALAATMVMSTLAFAATDSEVTGGEIKVSAKVIKSVIVRGNDSKAEVGRVDIDDSSLSHTKIHNWNTIGSLEVGGGSKARVGTVELDKSNITGGSITLSTTVNHSVKSLGGSDVNIGRFDADEAKLTHATVNITTKANSVTVKNGGELDMGTVNIH